MKTDWFTGSSVLRIRTHRMTIHLLAYPSAWYLGRRTLRHMRRFTYYGFGPLGELVIWER